jgi:hypothetical protein
MNYNPPNYFGGECLTVYYDRLQRDGWAMSIKEYQGATLFEKRLPKSWLIRHSNDERMRISEFWPGIGQAHLANLRKDGGPTRI